MKQYQKQLDLFPVIQFRADSKVAFNTVSYDRKKGIKVNPSYRFERFVRRTLLYFIETRKARVRVLPNQSHLEGECKLEGCQSCRKYHPKIMRANNIFFKKNLNASRPSEHPPVRGQKMSKHLRGIIGCKDKTSSWHLIGFPNGGDIGSTVSSRGETHPYTGTYTGIYCRVVLHFKGRVHPKKVKMSTVQRTIIPEKLLTVFYITLTYKTCRLLQSRVVMPPCRPTPEVLTKQSRQTNPSGMKLRK